MMSHLQDLIKQASEKIEAEKEKLFEDRMKQFGYQDILDDLKASPKRRFKKVIREIDQYGTQRIYVDDGTVLGQLILTIIPDKIENTPIEMLDRTATLKLGFTYK